MTLAAPEGETTPGPCPRCVDPDGFDGTDEAFVSVLMSLVGHCMAGSAGSPARALLLSPIGQFRLVAQKDDADIVLRGPVTSGEPRVDLLRTLRKLIEPGDPRLALNLALARMVMPANLLLGVSPPVGEVERFDAHVHCGSIFQIEDRLTSLIIAYGRDAHGPAVPPEIRDDVGLLFRYVFARAAASGDQHERIVERLVGISDHIVSGTSSRRSRGDLLSALVRVYANLVPTPKGGFHDFNRSFHGVVDQNPKAWGRAVKAVALDAQLARLELRVNARPPDDDEPWGSKAPTLAPLLQKIEDLSPIAISVPTGIQRHRLCRGAASRRMASVALPGFNGLVRQVTSKPWAQASTVLDHFDVSGREELSAPGWCLALVTWVLRQTVAERGDASTISVHAGESFRYPLCGVRRVVQSAAFAARPDRLGHGVALGSMVDHWCRRCVRAGVEGSRLLDIVEDLLWYCTEVGGIDAAEPEVREALAHTTSLIADAWPEARALNSLDEWIEAYETSLHPSSWVSLGLVRDNGGSLQTAWHPRVPGTAALERAWRFMAATAGLAAQDGPRVTAPPDVVVDAVTVAGRRGRTMAVDRLRESQQVIEACPTSNVWIGSVPWFASHPLFELVEAGIQLSLNTDNPGLFSISIRSEEEVVASVHELCSGAVAPIESILATTRSTGARSTSVGAGPFADNVFA